MPAAERKKMIASLETQLDAKILAIVTGDRQGMETRIAPDLLPLISEHLSQIGQADNLAIFIYTPGGDSIAGWGIVNLLREYCNNLKVLVPFRALSCGTLIALGANEIIMGKHGLLSPIDPSVSSPFNPPAPSLAGMPANAALLTVSVEDMIGFLELAKKEIGLETEQSLATVLSILSEKVHPLALGAVYRAREQSGSLATRLLTKHSNDTPRIEHIVKRLTQELPTHNYLIGRTEAVEDIKLNISEPSPEVDDLMWALYKEYESWLQLTRPANPLLDLGGEQYKRIRYERAAIESIRNGHLSQHIFITDNELIKITPPAQPGATPSLEQAGVRTLYQGWLAAEDGEVI